MAVQPDPAQAAALADALHILKVSQVYQAAIYAVAVWEYIVTIKDEITYVWPSPLSLAKVVFLLNRYLMLVFMALVTWQFNTDLGSNCAMWFRDQPYEGPVIFALCAIIMSLRVYAIYGKPRWMIPFFATLIIGEIVVTCIAASKGSQAPFPPGTDTCLWSNIGGYSWMWLFFAYPLILDCIICSMTIFRFLQLYRRAGSNNILTLIARDGIIFFVVVVTVNLINTISFITNTPAANPALHSPLSTIITSMMASRIVLNLRTLDTRRSNSPPGTFSFKQWNTSFLNKKTANSASPPQAAKQESEKPVGEDSFAIKLQRSPSMATTVDNEQTGSAKSVGRPEDLESGTAVVPSLDHGRLRRQGSGYEIQTAGRPDNSGQYQGVAITMETLSKVDSPAH